ncbi:MAG TPA: hypothetical protein VFE47_19330 [Tepidisphaeraceae bacterium]|jgi:hypothetical protein|nr:hypothetical protein [Tepidisphaeraceae bacterium]
MATKKPKAAKKVLGKTALNRVKGGTVKDMTNNQATTSQKAADKIDQYLRA